MLSLLQPDADCFTPIEYEPTHDRVPAELALGSPHGLRDDLFGLIAGEQVHFRPIDDVKYAMPE